MLDDDHPFVEARARRGHPTQPSSERLFGKDLVRRGERPHGHDDADVAHVPPLAEHEHADDAADGAVGLVDLSRGASRDVEVVLG